MSFVISMSGFALLVFTVSTIMDVNSPKQFGNKLKKCFGDRFRVVKTEDNDGAR